VPVQATYFVSRSQKSRVVSAEYPRLLFEQPHDDFLVDLDADGNVDGREDVVDHVDLLILIHSSAVGRTVRIKFSLDFVSKGYLKRRPT